MKNVGMLLCAVALYAQTGAASAPGPDHADLSYGPHSRNKLDLWLAKSDRSAPLVVFIHGGGFVSGDKSGASRVAIRRCLDAGVSFAAINYRFRTEVPIQVVLRDSARAIQYLRSKAGEFKVDKRRIAAMGGSAGAGTSLWLAFRDDLADAANSDPVLRESTRLAGAAATATQATYDLLRWPEVLGDDVKRYVTDIEIAAFYGLKEAGELRGPAGTKIRADVDMLGLISKDDPPVYLISAKRHEKLDSRGAVNHSPLHAIAVKKRCDEVGVPAVLRVVDGDVRDTDYLGFLLKNLGVK